MVSISKTKALEEEFTHETLRRAIIERCIKRQDGVFYMTSGEARQIYFDLKQITMHSSYIHTIGEEFKRLLLRNNVPLMDIRSVGGLETGAIPLITNLADTLGIVGFYVKKEHKRHALKNIIEGECREPFILIDDVVTTGYSMNLCQSILENEGYRDVRAKLCIVDRRATVYEQRNDVKCVFTEDELLRAK